MGSANVNEFNDENFDAEVLRSNLPVLVDFTATWCGPCKQLAPIVDQIAYDYAGKVKVGKVDIDDAPNTARKYGVRSVPTVMVFKGGQMVGTQTGLTNYQTLVKLL